MTRAQESTPSWGTGRTPVAARRGLVSTGHPLATAAGLGILQAGGNAFDAAIAAAAVIAVVEPNTNQVGGDVFALCLPTGRDEVVAINASGPAPAADAPGNYPQGIPTKGASASTVPGAVHAWETITRSFGSMPMATLLQPAIAYASEGFPVDHALEKSVSGAAAALGQFPSSSAVFLAGGNSPRAGQVLVQSDLGGTLRAIADGGADAFYRGPFANALAKAGGGFTREDLHGYACEVTQPLRTFYRGWEVIEQPLPSQGFVVLEQLNILEGFDLAAEEFGSAETLHLFVEAKKLAYADRLAHIGDPRFTTSPIAAILSKEFAAQRRMMLDRARASKTPRAGDPSLMGTDTTAISAADADGNAVTFIQSVFHGFGSAFVVPGTGVLLNNRRTGFSLDAASPNVLAGGKRPVHTLNTYMVRREGRLSFMGGSPGGHYQIQTNVQLITDIIDFGMHIQEAVDAPRWYHTEDTGQVMLESRFDPATGGVLRSRGHDVMWAPPWTGTSRAQIIGFDPDTGVMFGATDPRWHGQVLGF